MLCCHYYQVHVGEVWKWQVHYQNQARLCVNLFICYEETNFFLSNRLYLSVLILDEKKICMSVIQSVYQIVMTDEYDKYDDEFDDSDYNCGGDNDDVD